MVILSSGVLGLRDTAPFILRPRPSVTPRRKPRIQEVSWLEINARKENFANLVSSLNDITSLTDKFITIFRCIFTLCAWTSRAGISLSGYALLNVPQTTAYYLDAKWWWGMNTFSAREYILFVPAQVLRSGLATRAILIQVSQGRFGESVTRRRTCLWFHYYTLLHDCCWVIF
jgi:hypothetical protein